MSNSDGKVRIVVDSNAKEQAKALKEVQYGFAKTADSVDKAADAYKDYEKAVQHNVDTVFKASSAYSGYQKAIQDNITVLRELAIGGSQNTEGFKKLAEQTKEYKKILADADNQIKQLTEDTKQENSVADKLTGTIKKFFSAYLGMQGIRAVINYSAQSIEAFRQQDIAIKQLNQTLKNAGVYSYEYSQEIQKLASEIQSYSNFGDEAIIKAQALGQAYIGNTKITKELTKAVVDFAAATGMDLDQAFNLVGKSIGSSTNALGRYGIELKKGMTESQKMDAIQKQLAVRYEGSAKAMANGTVIMKNALGDLSEAFGGLFNQIVEDNQKTITKFVNDWIDGLNMVRINIAKTKNLDIKSTQEKIRQLYVEQETYNKMLQKGFVIGPLKNIYAQKLDETNKKIKEAENHVKSLIKAEEKAAITSSKNAFRLNDDYGISSVGGGISSSSKSVEKAKDQYEQLQDAVAKARREIELAALAHGTSSEEVQKAFVKYNQLSTQLSAISSLFENEKEQIKQIKNQYELLQEAVSNAKKEVELAAVEHGTASPEVQKAFENYKLLNTQLQEIAKIFEEQKEKIEEQKTEYQKLSEKIQETKEKLQELYLTEGQSDVFYQYKNQLVELETQMQKMNTAITSKIGVDWKNVSDSIKSNLSSALLTPLQQGESAFQRLATIGLNAVQLVGQAIIKNLLEQITLEKTLNAIRAAGKFVKSFFGFGFENGAAFQSGKVVPFARGGVVNQPTLFPMANGGTGLMGEAGAEAVMPLRRMSNGRLGVEADASNNQVVNIYNYSNAQVETRKRDDNTMDVFIRKVNEALTNERTSSGFRSAYAREEQKGVQAC